MEKLKPRTIAKECVDLKRCNTLKGYTDDLAARIAVFPNFCILLLNNEHNLA